MNDIPLELLYGILAILLITSAFFSSSETAMMAINRYRLKHLSKKGHSGAERVEQLLKRPDRLIGLILIGNNLANNFAAIVTTVIAIRLLGDSGALVGGIVLTLFMLVFAEVTPKTLATLYPERISFGSSLILKPLSYLLMPAVMLVNAISNGVTKLFGIHKVHSTIEHLDPEELRTVVDEAGELIPDQHQGMLLNILDLEKSTVEDIMIPRNEVAGLDLDDSVETLLEKIRSSEYTRLPVYSNDLNNVAGILHLRNVSRFLNGDDAQVTQDQILSFSDEPYFVPESTPLHTQLLNFQSQKCRIALVVNEYGEVQGIVTLEDLLEEIVGDFTTNIAEESEEDIIEQEDGSFKIHGGTFIRDINRALDWSLPTDGPKTLNGLAMEYMERIPDGNVSFSIDQYIFETVEITDKMIGWFRVQMDETVV
ncbi:HlyC/CorC family transporter [Gilvimarinus agarilyticus]|uniref:HlyC/CorC family transporter n=1 Tax=unclassified Gilvimarinus TaxID=2642066 RepID=UPI001C09302E|nr:MULTISPECIES: HlyC/CorC family transporter [unclassified Gilvimarinus]MBU2887055.1 HlyC/CorC family transporter [Gilvimarinus agarilyticus]MDO6571715.1 HlyC/CorC family transporter [Gilvimarinus sp. 2_MG-2023]MDO6745787.1 HlyC/CorC family transporter [Gilvimarinus sp. 1_MG-2023]